MRLSISFIYEDNQDSAKRSLTAFNKLIKSDAVNLVFAFGSNAAKVIAPLTEHRHVPLIVFGFEAKPAIGRRFVIRSLNHSDQYIAKLLEHLRKAGVKELAIVKSNHAFLISMVKSIRKQLRPEEELVEVAAVNPNDTDFRTIITKLRTRAIENVGLFLLPQQLVDFFKQARTQRYRFVPYGTDLFESASRIAASPGLVNGAIYPDNQPSGTFRESYTKRFSNQDQLTFAASGYDMAMLITTRLGKRRPASGKAIIAALSDSSSVDGVLGTYSFVATEEFGKYFDYPIVVKEISNRVGVPIIKSR